VWAKTNPMPESVTDRLSATYELVFLLTRSPSYFFDLDPIRAPLKRPDAADGTRIFGGANKARLGGIGASARRRGGTYGPPTSGASGKYRPDPDDARVRAHRGNLAITGRAHTAAHPRGRNPGDVWTLPTRPYSGAHSAPYPIDIPLRAIAAGCPPGGHVLDPFSGAATTGLAALQLRRAYTGIDINPAFHDLYRAKSLRRRSPGDRALGHAARRYSLTTPPSTRLRWIGASRSITVPGSWIGGRCLRLWCGRCSLKWRT
jgi:DNA methylase